MLYRSCPAGIQITDDAIIQLKERAWTATTRSAFGVATRQKVRY